jgi:murein DD-endopeptidase MepM/ murein hydrolase activator NlpD
MSIQRNKETLELEQEQLISLKESKEKENRLMKKEQVQRNEVLEGVQAEKKAYTSMIKELELAQEELNLIIKRLEERRKKAKIEHERGLKIAFEKRRGKLPWPVDGLVIREYGKIVHPVYKTVTMSNGIDIKITKGEKVFCVAPGTVDYVGWMRGYGKFVIVNHYGGYLTIYAHLDNITVVQGEEVKYGAVLGDSGDTGSLTGPKLHFQIRHSSETLNPRKWLEERE